METDSCYLSSHMQGEASPYLGLSMQPQMADVAWEAECLLVAGASGQSGPLLKQLLVILSERVSRGGQHWPGRGRANSGKAIRASLQGEIGIWLVGDRNQRQFFFIIVPSLLKRGPITGCLLDVCFSFEPSILLFGFPLPFTCLSSSHVITLGLRPANQLPLRF